MDLLSMTIYKLRAVFLTIPALSLQYTRLAMADKVARTLNLLGADRDLFNSPTRMLFSN